MSRRPKDKGTDAERAVVRFLQANGWPLAERRASNGATDRGDVTGCPGLVFEVKGGKQAWYASDKDVRDWLAETERELINARADYGVLVIQRAGVGPANAGRWWAIMRLDRLIDGRDPMRQTTAWPAVKDAPARLLLVDVALLLRADGYGQPLAVEVPDGA